MDLHFPSETLERLSAWMDGELPDDDRREMEAELASDAKLRDLLQVWRRNDQMIRDAFHAKA